jgi:hypothetical protein
MARRAVSLTLAEDNLLWLKGRAGHKDGNLSAAVDQLITDARAGRVGSSVPARSVVGTIDLGADDPGLQGADDVMRKLFAASVSRPSIARGSSLRYGVSARPRKAKRERG